MAQITVYSSNMCSTCEMVKQFLVLRGRDFVEKNVSSDLVGRSELQSLGFDSTPVTVIGDEIVEGFDTSRLDEALATL